MKKSLPFIRRNLPRAAAGLAALTLLCLGGEASAASGTWTQLTSGGTWAPSGTAPWASGIVADGIDATADFGTLNITASNTVRYNYSGTIGHLIFGDANPGQSWTLDNNGNAANVLTLATTSGVPTITTNSGINLVGVELTGTQGMTKLGAGTLVLAAGNSYAGGTVVSEGTLQIGNNSVNGTLGSGNVSIASGALLSFVGLNGTTTVSQTISGSGRVLKSGVGTTVVLSGSNTFTGGTTLSNGVLQGSDSTAYAGNANVLTNAGFGNSSPGTVAVTLGGASGTLQFRANGQNDSTAQTLTLFSNYSAASTSQQTLTMTQGGGGGNYVIDVNREGGTGSGKTLEIAGYSSLVRNGTLHVTGGNGYSLRLANLQLASGVAGANYTLNPTTASLKIGNITSTSGASVTLTLDGTSADNVVSGTISNNSGANLTSVTKANTGTWTLAGANTYTGSTTVSAGTLLVHGSLAAGSAVSVGSAGTLGGLGTIHGTVAVDGVLSPGASAGVLTVNNNVTLNEGGALAIELNGAAVGTEYDQLSLTGVSSLFSLTNTNNLQLTLGYVPQAGTRFTIVDIAGSNAVAGVFEQLNGMTTDLSQNAVFTVGSTQFKISYTAEGSTFEGLGNNIMLEVVPEPGAGALLALAGSIVVSLRRRRS